MIAGAFRNLDKIGSGPMAGSLGFERGDLLSDKRSVIEEAAWRASGGALEQVFKKLNPMDAVSKGSTGVDAILSSSRLQKSLDLAREYGSAHISEGVFDAFLKATRINLEAMGMGDGVAVKASASLADAMMKSLAPALETVDWKNGVGDAAAKSLAPMLGVLDWSRTFMDTAGTANLLKITSSLVGKTFTDRIARGTWDSFYVPGGDDAVVADRVTDFLSNAAGIEGNTRVVAEAEAIAQEPERVRRVLNVESFSWSSSKDVAALDKEADRIERKYGARWWASVMAVAGGGWTSTHAIVVEGLEALTPRRLALFAAGLSLAGAGIVGPIAGDLAPQLPAAVVQSMAQDVAEDAAPLIAATIVATKTGSEKIEVAVSTATERTRTLVINPAREIWGDLPFPLQLIIGNEVYNIGRALFVRTAVKIKSVATSRLRSDGE